jgi:high-affinity K+ transport system ATPase subunit B
MTRGSLTTFLIANDVANVCARACDVCRAPPWLAVNGVNLGSPTSEILSADRAPRI